MRRRSFARIACRVRLLRCATGLRPSPKRPLLVCRQYCVLPRKSNVSGRPCPRVFRFAIAYRPNSIRRVLSGCSSSPHWPSLSCSSCRNRFRVLLVLQARHVLVGVAHEDPCAARFLRSPLPPDPHIEYVLQVDVGEDRRKHRPLRRPLARIDPLAVFHGAPA